MTYRLLMVIAWPAFLAACVLQAVVFAMVDPLELAWSGHQLGWSRQAVYAGGFFLFWGGAMLSSALTMLLGTHGAPAAAQIPSPAQAAEH